MRRTFGVAAVAIVLVLASCSSVTTKPTSARPLTSDSATTWHSTFIDVCIEGGNAVTETWFVTPLLGWALAGGSADPQCPTFLRTLNGGLTWTPLRSPF